MARDLLYRVYERRLAREVGAGDLPAHVGVILDGNRRYAAARLLDAASGHAAGAANIDRFLDWCADLGIPFVTLWLLSTDNLGRDDDELRALLGIIGDTVERLGARGRPGRGRGVRITAVGALELLPEEVRARLRAAEEATAGREGLRVQVA
ncbi:MAG: undecaprenyl diphosphate synthase family protein, partial [Nitriliruptoraceae bacterium]